MACIPCLPHPTSSSTMALLFLLHLVIFLSGASAIESAVLTSMPVIPANEPITPAQALPANEPITPAPALATNEQITPSHALPANEPITPAVHALAANEPITPSHVLPANEPISPSVHALATNEPITPPDNNDHDMESDTLAETFRASEEPEPPAASVSLSRNFFNSRKMNIKV